MNLIILLFLIVVLGLIIYLFLKHFFKTRKKIKVIAPEIQEPKTSGPDHLSIPNPDYLSNPSPDYLSLCDISLPYTEPIIFENILSKEECKLIKKLALDKGLESSKVKDDQVTMERKSKTCWLAFNDHPLIDKLYDRVEKITGQPKSKCEELQVVQYHPNEFFNYHYDQCFMKDDYCKKELKRYHQRPRDRTMIIYLNEPTEYSGGETVFLNLDKEFKEPAGTGVLFENLDQSKTFVHPKAKHAGTPVISGEKWICNLWIRS
jgi:prolyl 4-hydroxylase